jgi:hypothetical protein
VIDARQLCSLDHGGRQSTDLEPAAFPENFDKTSILPRKLKPRICIQECHSQLAVSFVYGAVMVEGSCHSSRFVFIIGFGMNRNQMRGQHIFG